MYKKNYKRYSTFEMIAEAHTWHVAQGRTNETICVHLGTHTPKYAERVKKRLDST